MTPPVKSPLPTWMQSDTLRAVNNKKQVRQKYRDSSIQYRVAIAETKKNVKRDKINQLSGGLDEVSNLPLAMQKVEN